LSMPKISGSETFKRIKEIDSEARIILTSGYHEQEAAKDIAVRGLAGFLQKPYRFEALRNIVRSAVEGE
jgi:two-component system cell cycle sensor histidine kinase/response regulator CckA